MSAPYLGIDSASAYLALALWWPHEHRCVRAAQRVERQLSRVLHTQVTELMAQQQLRVSDLAGIAVGGGPGSTTGVRIGQAFAQGVARARGIPLVIGDSLHALAVAALASGSRGWVALEGRRNHFWVEEGYHHETGQWSVLTLRSEQPRAALDPHTHLDLAPDACAHLQAAWPAPMTRA